MSIRGVDNVVKPLRYGFVHEVNFGLQERKGVVWSIVGSTSDELAGKSFDEMHSMNLYPLVGNFLRCSPCC